MGCFVRHMLFGLCDYSFRSQPSFKVNHLIFISLSLWNLNLGMKFMHVSFSCKNKKCMLNVFIGYIYTNTVKLFFKSFFFLNVLRIILSSLFSIKCFPYYLFHILILYLVLLIVKNIFKSTCINCTRLSILMYTCILHIMLFLKNK